MIARQAWADRDRGLEIWLRNPPRVQIESNKRYAAQRAPDCLEPLQNRAKPPQIAGVKRVLPPRQTDPVNRWATVLQERITVYQEPNHGSSGTARPVFQERMNGITGTAPPDRLVLNQRVAKTIRTPNLLSYSLKRLTTPAALPLLEKLNEKGKGRRHSAVEALAAEPQ